MPEAADADPLIAEGDPEEDADALAALPATMADLFLALVAVVVLMLLSLLPAVTTPGRLAPADAAAEPWRSGAVTLDGERPRVLVAGAGGIRILDIDTDAGSAAGSEDGRLVGLDALFGDAGLAAVLTEAATGGLPILFVIEPAGGEAAFLFDAVASGAGLATYAQMRLGSDCAAADAPSRTSACPPGGAP